MMFDFLDPILRERLNDPEVAAAWGEAQRRGRVSIVLDEDFERGRYADLMDESGGADMCKRRALRN